MSDPYVLGPTGTEKGRDVSGPDQNGVHVAVTEDYETARDSLIGDSIYVPSDNDEFIDPRLKDYTVSLVAKTVDLHNDPM